MTIRGKQTGYHLSYKNEKNMNTIKSLNVGDEVLVKNWDDSFEKCKIVEINHQTNFLIVMYDDGVVMRSSLGWLDETFVRRVQHTIPNN